MKILFLILSLIFSSVSFGMERAPLSVQVITGSYTVPARKIAKVVVNLEGSATFTIGGVTALKGTQNSVLASSVLTYKVASTSRQLSVNTGGEATAHGDAFTSVVDQKTTIAQLELPAGTVLNGTGTWRAIVTLYER